MNKNIVLIGLIGLYACSHQATQNAQKVNRPCNDKKTSILPDSLFNAIQIGDLERVARYIEVRKASINACDSGGHRVPLTAAVKFNQPAIFEYLIQEGGVPSIRDSWGTPACVASLYGRDSLLLRLLDLGVSPNEKCNSGTPILSYAVSEARYSTVEILLKRGANQFQANEDGLKPLARAKRQGDTKMIDLLNRYKADSGLEQICD